MIDLAAGLTEKQDEALKELKRAERFKKDWCPVDYKDVRAIQRWIDRAKKACREAGLE